MTSADLLTTLQARQIAARQAKDWPALRAADATYAAALGLSAKGLATRERIHRAAFATTLKAHAGDHARTRSYCIDQAQHCDHRAQRIRLHASPGHHSAEAAAVIKDREAAR